MGVNSVKIRKNYMVMLALLSLSALAGCGQGLGIPEHQKVAAPVYDDQAGWFVQVNQQQQVVDFLNNHPEAKIKVVYQPNHSYEISNVSEQALLNELKPNIIIKNKVFKPNKISQLKVDRLLEKMSEADTKNEFSRCSPLANAPSGKITAQSPTDLDINYLVEAGQTITLGSEGSVDFDGQSDGLIKGWGIEAPEGSSISPEAIMGEELSFTPDVTGRYDVLLLVQNSSAGCSLESLSFAATKNRPFNNTQTLALDDHSSSQDEIYHLQATQAYEAWNISTGTDVVIAVVDSGVNYLHPELRNQIFVNSDEIPNNGIDDDDNGFIDDYAGYDFANADPHSYDDDGHGSHVAGLAAAETFGMANGAKIMPLKAMGPLKGDIVSLYAAILYAVDNGANIINLSLGQYARKAHPLMKLAIDHAEENNVLVVAAAGNGHPQTGLSLDIEVIPMFPAALPNDNILSVAARSKTRELTSYSNYGINSVDIVAPGGDARDKQFSTYKEVNEIEEYKGLVGTSMASPVVAGAAALVLAQQPDLTPAQVKQVILDSGDEVESLKTKVLSGKQLNALQAVNSAIHLM